MSIYDLSTTASDNTTVGGIGVSEGMVPGLVNNAIRGLGADLRKWMNDLGGAATAGGSANALTLTTSSGLSSYADGFMVSFVAASTNTGAATLSVDGVGAKAIRKNGDAALVGSEIVAGAHYLAQYDASANSGSGAWLLINPSHEGYTGGYLASTVPALNGKTTLSNADAFFITDSAASNGPKKVTFQNLKASVLTSPVMTGNGSISGGFASTSWGRFGTASTGGGQGIEVGSNGDTAYIAPTNMAGGLDYSKRLAFQAAGWGMWMAEGGFRVGGDLLVTGSATVKGWQVGLTVATVAGLTAKLKSTLTDGDTILVHAAGTGGVFKWVAASTEYADGGIVLASDEGGTGRWIRQFEGAEVYFVWWGGVVNSEASAAANSTALDAFIEFFRNSSLYFTASLVFGAGRWYFSGEHDFGTVGTSRTLVMRGMGNGVTYLATTLAGADKVFIRNGPTGTERDNRISFRGITFEARNVAGTVCPVVIWCDDWQESVMDDCRIVAPALAGQLPGTHAVFRAVWNCTLQDSHFLGGGDYRPQNPLTDTVRFTLTSGSAVVTASEAVFSAGDVGRDFMFGTPSGLWWGTVSTYDSTTQVTLTENAPLSMSSVQGWSEPVTASTTATDNTVTLSHDSAVASDVGRWVVIRSAGTVNSRQSAHYAQITAVNSATSIEVSPAPPRTVSGVTMYWSPQVVIYENDSALPVRTNDFTITNTRFYFYRGLAMAIMNAVQMKFTEAKFHGASPGYDETARGMSQAALLIQSTGGTFDGVCEAAGWDDGRIICTGSDHFVVESWMGRCAKGKAILYSEHPVNQYSTFTLGECQVFNQQYDVTSAGQRTAGYLAGPSGVRQTFNMVGPVSVGSGTGKRLIGGGPGMIVTGISARGSEFTFIADNASDSFELPGSYRNGAQKAGIIHVFTLSGKGAVFSFQTNGSSSYNCELIAGDTGFWAASNTPNATTASRVTVSVGNSVFYINNDVGTAHSFNWLPIG